MRYTTPINTLAVNSSGERQLEAHHLDDNFAAQDNAIGAITRALFAAGGVAKAGTVTLTGANLRVQDRVGVTLDTSAALHVTDLTLDLTTLPAGKGTVVMTTDPVTVNRTYTDVVTQENLTDTMTVRLGRLYVMGAGTAGVTLNAQGYPVPPQNTVPVAHVTRTAGGATLDETLNPVITVNTVQGPAGAAGVSVTGAAINGSGHLILMLSSGSTIDAGAVGGGGTGLPAGGTTGQVLTKLSATDGDAGWQTPAAGSGGGGAALTRTTAGTGSNAAITSYTVSPAAHSTYTDSGGELTNSVLPAAGAAYTDPTWVGWQNTNVTVNLDFGAALTPGSLAAYTFGGGTGSIYSPSNITVFNSTDNVNWTQVSTTDYATDGGSGWQVAPAPGTARYWRMVFTRRTTSSWIFIGEVKAQPTAKVTGLPAGYMLRSSERQSGVNEVLLTLMPTRVDVVNSEGMVKASAWMTGGDTWAYTN